MWPLYRRSSRGNQRTRTSEKVIHPRQNSPSESDIQNAKSIKNEGNALFKKGKYIAAAEKYSEAIAFYPKWPVPFVNRANCYKQLERWEEVQRDCEQAIRIESEHMKAHYFLGIALEMQGEMQTALIHLEKSYELARDQKDQVMDEIWQKIAKVNYEQWQMQFSERAQQDIILKQRILSIFRIEHQKEMQKTNNMDEKKKEQGKELASIEDLFKRASEKDQAEEVPNCFTCPMTMDVFRDPVISPSGVSYENSMLRAHLDKSDSIDPITRQHVDSSQLIRNLNLRTASQLYLNEHPWAWKESM